MGNSGSAHNISSGRSGIDRSSQFHQSHFKHLSQQNAHHHQFSRTSNFRTSPINQPQQRNLNPHWRRSYQPPGVERGEAKTQAEIPFKVLPELEKKLHLRATTNGAILNSGGTISGRKPNESISNNNALSQRSKTFIIETRKDGNDSNRNVNHDLHTEFTRSQTLLYHKAKLRDSQTNLSRMQRHTFSEPELINKLNQQQQQQQQQQSKNALDASTRPTTSNRNKYSKKRRAPEAPAVAVNNTTAAPTVKNNAEILRLKPDHVNGKPTSHFAKNTDRQMKLTKPPLKPVQSHQSDAFKRGNEKRNSLSGNHPQSPAIERPPYVYRREKSSDAIMLKSRKSENLENTTTIKIPVKMEQHMPKEPQEEVIATKAPQQQRTFYFGMEMVGGSSEVTKTLSVDENLGNEEVSLPTLCNYDMEYKNTSSPEESMNDNGLLVHIRPTLPRRQAETPSFSPMLAWRSLMEELDRVESSQMKENLNIWAANANNERPIQPNRSNTQSRQLPRSQQMNTTWTPEQDLGDDNDDRVKGLNSDDDTSSDEYRSKWEGDNLLFYGSKMKKSGQTQMAPIHTFSLSLPRDSHLQHNRGLDAGDVCIYKSLQKSKPDDYFNNNGSARKSTTQLKHDQAEGCNNWLLHKNLGGGVEQHTKSLEYGNKKQRMVNIEPQSIKFLTGGKHVMYLPGNNESTNATKTVPAAATATVEEAKPKSNRHFKSRQRHIPQSLQDKTPIFPTMEQQSFKLDDEKPLHQRFSFNNPVRLLEKKLHTEKSVKAAKTKLSLEDELEALKKVEEDFQRNRANEKENIQHQLRLHFGNDDEHFEQYHSLPIAPVLERFSAINLNDSNHKLNGRHDPEGCVSNVPYAANESEEHNNNNITFATKIFS
ncbi:uncharacterized protein DDB_G0290301-like isoform X1 [Drosophila sulfurigaster albostrigata]|uniref:uncharacterized protein DDB_G0290301-like isoform X1 n=1 Tax=Drosophila sulfurigaster albostrigata TaxID=89887 RepID=UPI002D21E42D|nr:uncharacterized protein DDB_G0290301-like isoform X1 [Drosophila sulfurigaster albostrigata]XP_062141091.1 uncharacterized protein DDB_G0290301-like isoform X1 [Drosophila sulfurigaster albostrigata]XP_062141099.1 uncharacterized protein DDB_G0290301-like isoform X1 [Drosophila sulfurigaster albostrigata]